MQKTVLTFGLTAGAILAAVMIATLPFQDRIGYGLGMVVGYSSMVAAFLMVYFGVRSYRDRNGAGHIGFGRALLLGALIALVASLCYVATWEVIFYQTMPDFGDQYAAHVLQKARESGASEAQLAAKTKELAEFQALYRNPLYNAAMTLIEPLPVGLVFALVTAGVLGRRRPVAGTAAA
jgi:hypothetical protein